MALLDSNYFGCVAISRNFATAQKLCLSSRTFNSSFTSDEYVEQRKLLVFKASKLEKITNLVKGAFPIN